MPAPRRSDDAQLSEDLYEAYRASQSEWAEQASEDLEFYNGAHWTDEQRAVLRERGQKPVTINTTYQLVEQAVAMLTSDSPSFRATAREDADVEAAQVRSDLLQWIWQQSSAQRALKASIRDYYVQGRGVLYAFVDPDADYGKGEVRVIDLDPKDVFPDPNSKDPLWGDAAHVLVRRILTAEQIKARWPEAPLEQAAEHDAWDYGPTGRSSGHDYTLFQSEITDTAHRRYEVIERFTKVDRPFWRLTDPESGQEEILSEDAYAERRADDAYRVEGPGGPKAVTDPEAVARFDMIFESVGEVFHQRYPSPEVGPQGEPVPQPPRLERGPEEGAAREVPSSTRRLEPTTVGALIDEGLLPAQRFLRTRVRVVATCGGYELYAPFDLPTAAYPVVPLTNGHNRNPYALSDVRRVKDLQEQINKTNSLILAHAANSTNLKTFYPEGSIQNQAHYEEQWGKAGTAFIPYDPSYGERGGIYFASPPPLPAELYQNMERFIQLMERTLGIFSMQQGDPRGAPSTFKGTLQIDEFGMRRIKSKMDDIYGALERLGETVLDYAGALYRPGKTIRLTEPSGAARQSILGQAGSFAGEQERRQDVMVTAGSTLPSNRWALLEQYLQMYQAGIVDDIAVLKKTEIPDAGQILKRKATYKQMQAAIKKQQKTIKELSGDLQTMQRQTMNAEKRAELEKFKARLKGYQGEIQKAGQLFESSLRSEQEKQQALLAQERSLRSQSERVASSSE